MMLNKYKELEIDINNQIPIKIVELIKQINKTSLNTIQDNDEKIKLDHKRTLLDSVQKVDVVILTVLPEEYKAVCSKLTNLCRWNGNRIIITYMLGKSQKI